MAERRRPMSDINVVPYIDVMLVLLVIFMATAPLLTQGVVVDLPDAASEPVPEDQQDPLVVSVRADGAIFVNVGMTADGGD
ncbi:MAG: biopolymer transporter ExbD, partial [Gammaproteobacteria bacterium]